VLPEETRNPYLRADSLIELLSWQDVDFVRCAYVTVLGRQPDPEGEAYYTHRIRQGYSKLQVLWQLRHSSEAGRHDPGIAGFDRALKKSRWERGWLGLLVRPFTGGESDSPVWRRHRMLINEVGRNSWAFPDHSLVTADLRNLTAQLGGLTEAVARLASGSGITAKSISNHTQFPENPEYRHLSANGQKIYRQVYARSH
jgi:hypothetical protein